MAFVWSYKFKLGFGILVGENPDFARIELREGDLVEVWGVVVWVDRIL